MLWLHRADRGREDARASVLSDQISNQRWWAMNTTNTSSTNAVNRRKFERFAVSPMYTEVKVCALDEHRPTFLGHAYDVSEGGVQFELDRGIAAGTTVAMELTFPGGSFGTLGHEEGGNTVVVIGNVVWVDDSEPGPVRMAIAITRFAKETDRQRLLNQLTTHRVRRAA